MLLHGWFHVVTQNVIRSSYHRGRELLSCKCKAPQYVRKAFDSTKLNIKTFHDAYNEKDKNIIKNVYIFCIHFLYTKCIQMYTFFESRFEFKSVNISGSFMKKLQVLTKKKHEWFILSKKYVNTESRPVQLADTVSQTLKPGYIKRA